MKKLLIGILLILIPLFAFQDHIVKAVSEVNLIDFYRDGKYIYERNPSTWGNGDIIQIPDRFVEKKEDFRAVWVATVYNIDLPRHTSKEQYQANFLSILQNLQAMNMNAVVFQISSTNDAFYPSEIVPWTRWLTGTEGQDPGWDPLAWMIEESHKRGIEFHAWMNPYNVHKSPGAAKANYLASLDPMNFARQNPDLVLESNSATPGLTLNPGEPVVVDYVVSKVQEVIENYDVDAIHFDDYFYPYEGFKTGQDQEAYIKYGDGMTLADWRRNNVNTMVQSVSEAIYTYNLATNKRIQFGISPFGVWCNKGSVQCVANGQEGSITRNNQSFVTEHADTLKWIREEWLDYVAPQLYWGFENMTSTYSHTLDWWADAVKGTNVNLYSGMAIYRSEEPLNSSNALGMRPTEIADQVLYNSKHPEVKGSIFYNYSSFVSGRPNLQASLNTIMEEYWLTKTLTPASRRYESHVAQDVVENEKLSSVNDSYKLSWDKHPNAFGYAIYKTQKNETVDFSSIDHYLGFVSNQDVQGRITFFDKKDTMDVDYYIKVVDFFKTESQETRSLSSSTLAPDDGIYVPLEKVQNLRIIGKILLEKEVRINWNQVTASPYGSIHYAVYKSLDGNNFVKLDETSTERVGTTYSHSYTFKPEDLGNTVTFHVKATDGHLYSTSNTVSAYVEEILPLSELTNFQVEKPFVINSSIRFSWDRLLPSQDVSVQYTLYASTDGVNYTKLNQTQNLIVFEETTARFSYFIRSEFAEDVIHFKLEATDTYSTVSANLTVNVLTGEPVAAVAKVQSKLMQFFQRILK